MKKQKLNKMKKQIIEVVKIYSKKTGKHVYTFTLFIKKTKQETILTKKKQKDF